MAKTQRELAFLRDLYLNETWTRRFTDLIDKHFKFEDEESLLYLNSGTGDHAFALNERIGQKTGIFARSDNEDLLLIARDKAAAIRSGVEFSIEHFEESAFDAVLADASLVSSFTLPELIDEAVRVAKYGGKIGIVLISAGSFGEIFSVLWEVLFHEDLGEHAARTERLIVETPTITRLEEMAQEAGLVNIETHTATEIFEYENGKEFVESPLLADFLLPAWLDTLDENENERVTEKLAQLIDSDEGAIAFQFSIKATLITAEKA